MADPEVTCVDTFSKNLCYALSFGLYSEDQSSAELVTLKKQDLLRIVCFGSSQPEPYCRLSNFQAARFVYGGREWPSSEHCFQALFESQSRFGLEAKKKSSAYEYSVDDDSLFWFLVPILVAKFKQNSDLLELLLETRGKELVECSRPGENGAVVNRWTGYVSEGQIQGPNLGGNLLMFVRSILSNEQPSTLRLEETTRVSFADIRVPSSLWLTCYPQCSDENPCRLLQARLVGAVPSTELLERLSTVSGLAINAETTAFEVGISICSIETQPDVLNLYWHGWLWPNGAQVGSSGICTPLVGLLDGAGVLPDAAYSPSEMHYHSAGDLAVVAEHARLLQQEEGFDAETALAVAQASIDVESLNFGHADAGVLRLKRQSWGAGLAFCIDNRHEHALRVCIVQLLLVTDLDPDSRRAVAAEASRRESESGSGSGSGSESVKKLDEDARAVVSRVAAALNAMGSNGTTLLSHHLRSLAKHFTVK